ncbi:hypothetical protein [uncultured Desulfuromusa sp.]|uniref:hypothetical protein n=1 Tax=uncultured Desulfuromusa sp. TaxID=219183 RepID=UPI002AA89097|nr:hypothetical protein [uncultured Desulfuromusa sp.]
MFYQKTCLTRYVALLSLFAMMLSLTSCGGGGGSSASTGSSNISLSVSSGTAATPIEISGIDTATYPADELTAVISGEDAPVFVGEDGKIYVVIPLFLDGSGDLNAPGDLVDLIIYSDDDEIYRLDDAINITPLPSAPGSTLEAELALQVISTALTELLPILSEGAGEQEQYLYATLTALDELINGVGEYSLDTVIDQLEGNPEALNILDSILYSSGVLDYFEQLAEFLQTEVSLVQKLDNKANRIAKVVESPTLKDMAFLADGEPVALLADINATTYTPSSTPETTMPLVELEDLDLAEMIQYHNHLKSFTQEVIDGTSVDFTLAMAAIIAAFSSSGSGIPIATALAAAAAIPATCMTIASFAINKVMLGYLPAKVDVIDVDVPCDKVWRSDSVDPTITVYAVNDPPQVTFLDYVNLSLTTLGFVPTFGVTSSITTAIGNVTSFYMGAFVNAVAAYTTAHPDLGLSPDITQTVEPRAWKAELTHRQLVNLVSLNPSVVWPSTYVTPDDDITWYAAGDADEGQTAVIYAQPAMIASYPFAQLVSGYEGTAFGDARVTSNEVEITISEDDCGDMSIGGTLDIWSYYNQLSTHCVEQQIEGIPTQVSCQDTYSYSTLKIDGNQSTYYIYGSFDQSAWRISYISVNSTTVGLQQDFDLTFEKYGTLIVTLDTSAVASNTSYQKLSISSRLYKDNYGDNSNLIGDAYVSSSVDINGFSVSVNPDTTYKMVNNVHMDCDANPIPNGASVICSVPAFNAITIRFIPD